MDMRFPYEFNCHADAMNFNLLPAAAHGELGTFGKR